MEITNVMEWQNNISTPITAENLNKVNTGTKTAIDSLETSSNTLIKTQSDSILPIYEKNEETRGYITEAENYIAKANANNVDAKNKLGGNKVEVVPFLPDGIDDDTLYFVYRLPDVPANFADATPLQIKNAFETDSVPSSWQVGDTKSITLSDGNAYTLRLLDMTKGRYERKNGTYSNCVIGFNEIIQTARMNTNYTNAGGWVESNIYKETMPQILAMLPQEWQDVISTVKVASTVGSQSTSVSYSDNTVFLPARVEVFGTVTDSGYKDEGTVFDYYKNSGSGQDSIRIKKYKDSANQWWLRSPYTGNADSFVYVNSFGGSGDVHVIYSYGVSPCFAL